MEEKVLMVLKDVNEDIVNYDGDNLYDDGIMDSIQSVDLVAELEETLDIEIDPSDVIEENFKTKEAIISLVKKVSSSK